PCSPFAIESDSSLPQEQRVEQFACARPSTAAPWRLGFLPETPLSDHLALGGRGENLRRPLAHERFEYVPGRIVHELEQPFVPRGERDFAVRRRFARAVRD